MTAAKTLEEIVTEHPLPWRLECQSVEGYFSGGGFYDKASTRAMSDAVLAVKLADAAPAMALAIRALLHSSSRQFAQGPQADLFRALRASLPPELRP